MAINTGSSGYSGFDYGVVTGPSGNAAQSVVISCFPSNTERCIVIREPKPGSGGFASMSAKTNFHGDELRDLTKQVNDLIARAIETESKGEGRDLHILKTEDGPMFAWVDTHVSISKTLPET